MEWPIVPGLRVADIMLGTGAPAPAVISVAFTPVWPTWSKLRVHFPMEDKDELPNMDLANSIAILGASLLYRNQEVLMHCIEGRNRSICLAGLILWHGQLLPRASTITNFLRECRPGALSNTTFAGYLDSLP